MIGWPIWWDGSQQCIREEGGRDVWKRILSLTQECRLMVIVSGFFKSALLLFSSSPQEVYPLLPALYVLLPLPLTKEDWREWSQAGYRAEWAGAEWCRLCGPPYGTRNRKDSRKPLILNCDSELWQWEIWGYGVTSLQDSGFLWAGRKKPREGSQVGNTRSLDKVKEKY